MFPSSGRSGFFICKVVGEGTEQRCLVRSAAFKGYGFKNFLMAGEPPISYSLKKQVVKLWTYICRGQICKEKGMGDSVSEYQ